MSYSHEKQEIQLPCFLSKLYSGLLSGNLQISMKSKKYYLYLKSINTSIHDDAEKNENEMLLMHKNCC